jgi:hypothetical protein
VRAQRIGSAESENSRRADLREFGSGGCGGLAAQNEMF